MTDAHILVTGEIVPQYAHHGDAGADLCASESVLLQPGERALVATGIRIALPDGFVGLVHPRSGLAIKHGVTVLNTPGTIDAGYRGEVKVILVNLGQEPFSVELGDRIAQLVVQRFERAEFTRVERLPGSDRGEGGFGSTGHRAAGDTTPDQE